MSENRWCMKGGGHGNQPVPCPRCTQDALVAELRKEVERLKPFAKMYAEEGRKSMVLLERVSALKQQLIAADKHVEIARKEVERLTAGNFAYAQGYLNRDLRITSLEQQLAEANEALLRNGCRCELCGCSVPKGAAYCSECWLPP